MKNNSIVHNSFMYMLKTIIGIVVPIVILPYATRTLGAAGIGRVQYVQSWITYFQLFACLGTSHYAVREGVKYRENKRDISRFTQEILTISIISTIIVYIVFFTFILISPTAESYRTLLLIFSCSIFANAMNTEWLCSIYEDYEFIAKRSIIVQFLSLILLFLLVRQRNDLNQYAFVLTFPSMVITLWNFLYLSKKVSFRKKEKLSIIPHIVPILLIFGSSIASTVYTTLDTTMLGVMSGDESVGLYYAANRLIKSVLTLVTASCTVFLPKLSVAAKNNDMEAFKALAYNAIGVLSLFSIPCSMGLILLSKEILYIFSGSEFCIASLAMKILAVDLIFSSLNGFLAWQILVPLKKERYTLLATSIGCFLDFVLNWIFIPKYNIEGAAVATLISEIVVFSILNLSIKNSIVSFNPYKIVGKYILAVIPFAVISLIVHKVASNMWLVTVIMVPLCIGIYGLIMIMQKDPTVIVVIDYFKSIFHRKLNVISHSKNEQQQI